MRTNEKAYANGTAFSYNTAGSARPDSAVAVHFRVYRAHYILGVYQGRRRQPVVKADDTSTILTIVV